MRKYIFISLLFVFIGSYTVNDEKLIHEVQLFLDNYNKTYQELYYKSSLAEWKLNTYIVEGDTLTKKLAQIASEELARFSGSTVNIETARKYLKDKDKLEQLQVKQLERILYLAGNNPETAGDIVKEKIKAETEQVEKLYGYDFKIDGRSVTTNEIDNRLEEENDLKERLKVWVASKEVGKNLKEGLIKLQNLRNKSVQALGYSDYFNYQVSDYGMTTEEMLALCKSMVKEIWPLYRELHTWARYTLAEKYGTEVPDMIPAHWLPNRWGQDWLAMVNVHGLDINSALKEKTSEWIVQQGEDFYVSLGFKKLPETFWEKSSLYPLPADAGYKKNNHASAWHMDLEYDVRSLMSVEPDAGWWETVLHELGHIYYYITYTNPDVPVILRKGANRGFHEAIGSLIGLASMQKPFLVHRGLADANAETEEIQILLKEALNYIVFIPWSAGVMTEFEHELYANNLSPDQFNKKWWDLVEKYQGIVPPFQRGEEFCDAATKTHINNDAAQYYDYAISYVLLMQFHKYISDVILNQDPHSTDYWGNKDIGTFLRDLMYPGSSVDWREHLNKTIGSPLSAKPMLEYFAPLLDHLKKINAGRTYTLPENFN